MAAWVTQLAFAKDDDAEGGDEQEHADDLEVEVEAGEKGLADEMDVGQRRLGPVIWTG